MKTPGVAEIEYCRSFRGYSETRPNYVPPCSPEGLLAGEPLFRHRYLPLLPADRRASILEIGSGCGEFLYFLQREGFQNARGVDLDSEQVRRGQRLGVRHLEVGNAEGVLADSVGSFDSVVAIDVLEHVPKAQVLEFLGLVRESLRPGGRFVCQVPNLAAFYLPHFYMDFTHETPFTASSLTQALRMAGFPDVRVFAMGPVPRGFKGCVRAALWCVVNGVLHFVAGVGGGSRNGLDSVFTPTIVAVSERK